MKEILFTAGNHICTAFADHAKTVSLLSIIGAVFGAIITKMGGWSSDMVTLLIFMGCDYITGLTVAGVFKKSQKTETGTLSSYVGFKGICKKVAMLLLVLIAYRLDITLGTTYIRTAVIMALIVNELISLTENLGLMGVPIPPIILKAIDILKNKDKDGE